MKITPKYKVNDIVWFYLTCPDKVIQARIDRVEIQIVPSSGDQFLNYHIEGYMGEFLEGHLFNTADEAFAALTG